MNRRVCASVAALASVFAAAAFFAVSLRQSDYTKEGFMLGTVVRVTVHADKKAAAAALDAAFAEISRLESLFSVNISSSDISRVNSAGRPTQVNAETADIVKFALSVAGETDGAFDPTLGRVVGLWKIGTPKPRVPAQSEITDALKFIDWRKVSVSSDKDKNYISAGVGQKIDLGGIAKGWIADRTAELLRARGIKSALIDLGGNIYVVGRSPKRREWIIGLQEPTKPRGADFAVVIAEDISIVTSGPYERFFDKNGKRWHHIFDPATGYPSQSGLLSVTVADKNSARADALCTAFFVMGLKKSEAFLREHKNVMAVFVDSKNVYITQNIRKYFKLTDKSRTLRVAGS